MYVLVQHYVQEPAGFWSNVEHAIGTLPPYLVLHHCIPTADGIHAVCVWECESLRDLKAFMETYIGHVSRNLYFPVENASGIALPSSLRRDV